MVISSRTPEGDPNRCPICGCDVRLEPSWPGRDAPCPQCGHLLWFGRAAVPEVKDPHVAILLIVQARFGPVPSEIREAALALRERIELKRVMHSALTAKTLAELLVRQ
jgi:hypothetical protein